MAAGGVDYEKRTANAEPIQPAKNEQIKRVLSKSKTIIRSRLR